MHNLRTPVLDHGFVTLRNLAGPTRRSASDDPLSAAYGRMFDADDVDPAQAARMSFDEMDGDRSARTIFITGPVLRRWGFHATWTRVDAYQWGAFCELAGIENKTPMDGGSDAAVSERNHLKRN